MIYDNGFIGVALLILCACLVILSRRYYKMDKYRLAALMLVLISLLCGLYITATPNLEPWDERYHALVAKNLMDHPLLPTLYDNPVLSYDYKQWAGNHIWVHKQPATLWGIALSMKVFGANVFAVRLPSVLMMASCVYFTFLLGKRLFNPRVGLILSLIHI